MNHMIRCRTDQLINDNKRCWTTISWQELVLNDPVMGMKQKVC